MQAQLGMQERPEIHLPPPVFGEETAKNKLVIPKGLPRSSWVLKKKWYFPLFLSGFMDFIPDWKQCDRIRLRARMVLSLSRALSIPGEGPEPLPARKSHWEGSSGPGREEGRCRAGEGDSTCN